MDGGDVGLAAFEGAGDAEEADDVAVVGVEELARGCSGGRVLVGLTWYL